MTVMSSRDFRVAFEEAFQAFRAEKKAAVTDAEEDAAEARFDAVRAKFNTITVVPKEVG